MSNRQEIFKSVATQIEPFNKKGIDLTEATTFAGAGESLGLKIVFAYNSSHRGTHGRGHGGGWRR